MILVVIALLGLVAVWGDWREQKDRQGGRR
jgi:hypothetical protein